jgi:uncharacterized membrane protein YhaH (DUF805 family)
MNPFLIGLQPLKRFADFRGRSTRTELTMFYILTSLTGMVANIASQIAALPDFLAGDLIWIVLLCPALALCVRRLHDTGRSGWWLLLEVPPAVVALWGRYLFWQSPLDFPRPHLPWLIEAPAAIPALAVLALLLWNDEELPNRYGPNPRYPDDVSQSDPPGELA